MTKSLSIRDQNIDFRLIEDTNYWCWQGCLPINNANIEFEIDCEFHKGEVNWSDVEDFLNYISSNNIIIQKSKDGLDSITQVGLDFFSNSAEVSDWKMNFKDSLYFLGRNNDGNFEYGFLYDYFIEENGIIEGDPYGLYMVRMENEKFVNAERHQL